MEGADFFDVDHTITRRSTGTHFFITGALNRLFPLSSLLLFPFMYLRFRLRSKKAHNTSGRADLPGLRGLSRDVLQRLSRQSFEERVDVYEEARNLIAELRSAGRRVVLATSSVEIIVRPLADHLGIDDVIANSLLFEGDICTGRFTDAPMFKDGKRRRVMDYLRKNDLSAEDSSFYSDSIHDLPLLREIGRPHVVNPRGALKRIARSRGWEIHRFA